MAEFAKVRVSPAKRFWRGQPKTRPFQLFVKPEGGQPIQLEGTLLQESVLPPWFLKALLLLIVAIVALILIWLFLLKPTIETAASDAVSSPLASLKDDVNQALSDAGLPTMGTGSGGTPTDAAPTPTLAPGDTAAPPTEAPPTPGGGGP